MNVGRKIARLYWFSIAQTEEKGGQQVKFITNYKELNGDSSESLLDHIAQDPIEGKEMVLLYLKSGKSDGVRCSGIFDYVANAPTLQTIHLFTDGEYFWDSEEIYHFEKYNLALDAKFIQKVLS